MTTEELRNKYSEYLNKEGFKGVSYVEWLEKRLSEREQPVKDGFEEWMEKEISLMNPQGKKMLNYIRVLTKYRSLSPCKEKWISEEEAKDLIRVIEHLHQALSYDDDIYPETLKEINRLYGKYLGFDTTPTGDNKKGEGNG